MTMYTNIECMLYAYCTLEMRVQICYNFVGGGKMPIKYKMEGFDDKTIYDGSITLMTSAQLKIKNP